MSLRSEKSVLFLLSSLGRAGSETRMVKLAGSLATRDVNVVLAYLNPPEELLADIDPRVTVIGLRRRGKFSIGALRRLATAIRAHGADTVVAVNLYPALYVALARLWLGRKQFRFFVSVNTTEFATNRHGRQLRLYRQVLRRADLVIFGASAQRRRWSDRYGLDISDAAAAILYNGVDTQRFVPREAAHCSRNMGLTARFVIGTVGGLRIEKQQSDLIRALAELRARGLDVEALVVGDGFERSRLVAEIERCKLQKHVVLAGTARDVRPLLGAMTLFVLPSRMETFSNAALEAMAMGVPVVSSAVGGMEELLARGGGVTYPAGDVARLSELLAELLSDPHRRRQMGEAARRAAVDHFGWEKMVDGFDALLTRPCVSRGERRRQLDAREHPSVHQS